MVKKAFLLLVFLFLPLQGVFADSGYLSPTSCGTPENDWSNCSEAYSQDGVYSTKDYSGGSSVQSWSGFTSGIGNYDLSGVTFRVRGHYIGSGTPHSLLLNLTKTNDSNYFGNLSGDCSSLYTITPTGSDTDIVTTIPISCWYQHSLVYSDFVTETGVNVTVSTNGSVTYYIDQIQININYVTMSSSLSIDSSEASPSGQFVSLDLSGTTATVSSSMSCSVRLLERCTKEGYAGYTSNSSVATILLENGPNTSTIDIGGGYYKAYDWGGNDNSWVAKGIHVPYNAGWSCDYPYSIICSDNHELVYLEDYSTNSQFVATPSAGITNTTYTEPEPSNPLAWVVWKIKQTLIDLFVPHNNTVLQMGDYINGLIQTKAPLAYGNAVLALDWSSESISTASPSIHIALTANNGGLIPDIDWTPPPVFNTGMNMIRNAGGIILWLSFILYLIIRIRGAFV